MGFIASKPKPPPPPPPPEPPTTSITSNSKDEALAREAKSANRNGLLSTVLSKKLSPNTQKTGGDSSTLG